MSDFRALSDRFDLTYVRRRHGIDRWIAPLSALVVLGVVCALALMSFQSNNRMYSSGTLTLAHDMFAQDCARCHQQDPDRSGFWLPARDEACLSCHDDTSHSRHGSPHAGGDLSFVDNEHPFARNCASCHTEHSGRIHDLARVPDMQCTVCHTDLDETGRIPGGVRRARPTHTSVNSFIADHPEWDVLSTQTEDPGTLRLNHKLHVVEENISCTACHVADMSGRTFEPISFDAHCRACHEADLGSVNVAGGIVEPFGSPHGSTDELSRDIRASLALAAARFAATPKETVESSEEPAEEAAPRRRRGRGNRDASPAKPEIPQFEDRAALDAWLDTETLKSITRLNTSCGKCHTTERSESGFTIAPVNIKPVWLDRAVFSHDAHVIVRCDECHPGARSGERTADVMLPGIESCQTCHTPAVGAPSDCVTCHTYHDHSRASGTGVRGIADLLTTR